MSEEIAFENLIGKTVLVGLTHQSKDGEIQDREQFWGTIMLVDESCEILIRKSTGEEYTLPPDLNSISIAQPGEYRLHSTGEIVVNPDLLSTWTITKP